MQKVSGCPLRVVICLNYVSSAGEAKFTQSVCLGHLDLAKDPI